MRELLQKAKQSANSLTDETVKNTLLKTIEWLEKKVEEFLLDIEDLTFITLDDLQIQLAEMPSFIEKTQTRIDEINSVDTRLKRNANAILKKLLEEGVQSLQDTLNKKRKPAANQSQASSSNEPGELIQSHSTSVSAEEMKSDVYFAPIVGPHVFIKIDFVALKEIAKRIKNEALRNKLITCLDEVGKFVAECNQHYERTQNSSDWNVTKSVKNIESVLNYFKQLAEKGDPKLGLMPMPEEKQWVHLIQQTLQRNLPGTYPVVLDRLIEIKDKKSRMLLTPSRSLINQAARRIFKHFLQNELRSFINTFGKAKKVFISYAWATPTYATYHRDKVYEAQIEKFAKDLERVGCEVYLDRWYDQVGKPLTEFLELMDQTNCFVPIGTNLYLQKYNKRAESENAREHVVKAEGQILNYIAAYSNGWRTKIKPVLLEGTPETTLPSLLRPNIPLELHNADYFECFFRLLRAIYNINNREEEFKQLESKFYQLIQSKSLDALDTEALQNVIQEYKEQKSQRSYKAPQFWAASGSQSSSVPVISGRVSATSPMQGAYAQDNRAQGHVLTFTQDGAQGSASAVGNKAGGNVVTMVGGKESLDAVLRALGKN